MGRETAVSDFYGSEAAVFLLAEIQATASFNTTLNTTLSQKFTAYHKTSHKTKTAIKPRIYAI